MRFSVRWLLSRRAWAFVCALALLPLLLLLLKNSTTELVDSRKWVEHTYTVIHQLDRLRIDVEVIETARRGYLMTGLENYLVPFYGAHNRIPDDISALQLLLSDNMDQHDRLEELTPVVMTLLKHNQANISAPPKDFSAGMTHAKVLIDQIRQSIDRMQDQEESLLALRIANSENKLHNLWLMLMGTGIAFVFLLIFIFGRMYREISQRRQVEIGLKESQALNELAVHNLSLMREMTALLQACANTEEALNVISQFASRLLHVDAGVLYLFRESRNQLESQAHWGAAIKSEVMFQPDDCWALRRGEIHYHGNETPLACKHLHANADTFSMCIPIVAQGNVLGIMYLENQHAIEISTVERDIAINLASQIALSLASIKLRDTLRNLSVRDPLTGLFNRRYMEESLLRELATANRKGREVGVVIFDLDHFKKFNDTFGHEAGDLLLREVGALLTKNSRGGDVTCRFGGEEFVIIYPETPLEMVVQLANQLRELIYALQLQHFGRSLGQISASFGVACFPVHGTVGEDLLRAADKALYEAKAAGRNCVKVATIA